MQTSNDASISFARSRDVSLFLQLRVGNLIGYRTDADQQLPDLYIVFQLWSDNRPLLVPYQTAFKAFKSSFIWNETFTLPIKYKDLPLNAQLAFTVYRSRGPPAASAAVPLGGSTLRLFGKKCTLRKGQQRLYLWEGKEADGLATSSTPSKIPLAAGETDELGRLEKVSTSLHIFHCLRRSRVQLVKKHEAGDMDRSDWLDNLAFREIEKIIAVETQKSNKMYLYIDLPRFDFPVVFSDLVCIFDLICSRSC